MGVPGLLPALKGITHRVSVSELSGQTAGIDAMCWIHRGSISCAQDLVEGAIADGHIRFCMSMLDLLASNGVRPIMVFDGAPLPSKANCNESRQNLRAKNKALARSASECGDSALASSLYQRAVTITAAMISDLIISLDTVGVEYIVAPYEADAQLAHLSRERLIDIVISEDSDCLVFGCRQVLYKLGRDGVGEMIMRSDLGANSSMSFANWRDEQFRLFCCVAGCDYVSKVKGLGIKTAHRIVNRLKTLPAVMAALRLDFQVDDAWALEIARAMLIFKHQVVTSPTSGCRRHLTPLDNHHAAFLLSAHLASPTSSGTVSRDAITVDVSFLGDLTTHSSRAVEHITPQHDQSSPALSSTRIAPPEHFTPLLSVHDKSTSLLTLNSPTFSLRRVAYSKLQQHSAELASSVRNENGIETLQHKRRRLGMALTIEYPSPPVKLPQAAEREEDGSIQYVPHFSLFSKQQPAEPTLRRSKGRGVDYWDQKLLW